MAERFSPHPIEQEHKNDLTTLERDIKNTERLNAPEIELAPFAKKELQKLVAVLRETNESEEAKNVVAVVRCWKKNKESLQKLLARLQQMRHTMPELRGLFISINADQDTNDQTTLALQEIVTASPDSDFPIIPVKVKNYSWTAGLNAPAAVLHKLLTDNDLDEAQTHMLNQSFDVELSDEQAGIMAKRVREGKPLLTLRTSTGEATPDEIKTYIQMAKPILADDSSPTERAAYLRDNPGLVTLVRNTCSIASLKDIVELGGYSPKTNRYGGMEDHDFIMRLLISSDAPTRRKLLRAFLSPEAYVAYRDAAWEKISFGDKTYKKNRERNANVLIASDLADRRKNNDFIVKPKDRDFVFE